MQHKTTLSHAEIFSHLSLADRDLVQLGLGMRLTGLCLFAASDDTTPEGRAAAAEDIARIQAMMEAIYSIDPNELN